MEIFSCAKPKGNFLALVTSGIKSSIGGQEQYLMNSYFHKIHSYLLRKLVVSTVLRFHYVAKRLLNLTEMSLWTIASILDYVESLTSRLQKQIMSRNVRKEVSSSLLFPIPVTFVSLASKFHCCKLDVNTFRLINQIWFFNAVTNSDLFSGYFLQFSFWFC